MPRDTQSPDLARLQALFGAALRDPGGAQALDTALRADAPGAAARLRVYRHNAAAIYEGALARSFPVLRKRVGEDYFAQLAHEYRRAQPSRSGDLHWVGQGFADWLAHEHAGDELAWLAELARLEWACEEALVAAQREPLTRNALAAVRPEALADLRLRLQDSLRLIAADCPVWSVWSANQGAEAGPPVDLSAGGEFVALHCGADGLVLRRVPSREWDFVKALAAGATLGEAFEATGLDANALQRVLEWLFDDGLVVELLGTPRG